MDAICKHGKAKRFAAEKPQDDEFSSCCHNGKINLPTMTPPPEYVENTTDSKNFKAKIRQYINDLAFASMGMYINVYSSLRLWLHNFRAKIFNQKLYTIIKGLL